MKALPALLLTLVSLHAAGAVAEKWPKEIVDSVQANCAAMAMRQADAPASEKPKVDAFCTCLVTRFQGAVSIQDFMAISTMPAEQAQQSPAAQTIKQISDSCRQ